MTSKDNNIPTELSKILSPFMNRYGASVVIKLCEKHPELFIEIKELANNALDNRHTDKINSLLAESHLPAYPDNFTLEDFDINCLTDKDKAVYEKLLKDDYLNIYNPNHILYGLPKRGKEKLLIGLGDYYCKKGYSVKYYSFTDFINIIQKRDKEPIYNKAFDELLKIDFLLINDFPNRHIYDKDLVSEFDEIFIKRLEEHVKSVVSFNHDSSKYIKPYVTIISTYYNPMEWIKHFDGDNLQVLNIITNLYDEEQTITIDERNNHQEDIKE